MIGNGIIAKLQILQLEADVALQWGAALTKAAEEYQISQPLAQSMWLANIMTNTQGLTILDPPVRVFEDIDRHAQIFGAMWKQGWRGQESNALKQWHKRVSLAMGL